MRLAQLARKLDVRSMEIVDVLAKANLPIDDNSNSKLTEQQLAFLLKHYGGPNEQESTGIDNGEDANVPSEEGSPEMTDVENGSKPASESESPTPVEPQPSPEVIKPVKVSLPGLKVVGKIELPEPKKKPEADVAGAEPETSNDAEKKDQRGRKSRNAPRRSQQIARPRKNPIALEREREEREALRRKLEQQKREKEARTNNYFKKLQDAKPQKKLNKRRKTAEQFETLENHEMQLELPKTLLGKIWRWLKPPTRY